MELADGTSHISFTSTIPIVNMHVHLKPTSEPLVVVCVVVQVHACCDRSSLSGPALE